MAPPLRPIDTAPHLPGLSTAPGRRPICPPGGPQGSSAGPQDDNVSLSPCRHFAAFKRKPAAVAVLLAHPTCDPFVLDRKGRTPAEDTSDEAIRAAIVAAQEQVLAAVPKAAMSV